MKKQVLFLLIMMSMLSLTSEGAINSIADYLLRLDNQYYLVVGAESQGGDVFAASEIAAGLKKDLAVDLQLGVEGKVNPKVSKILVGHPCDNQLIALSCDEWPYNDGEALVKIIGNDLVIAGSTSDDTRRAAEVITHYKEFPILEDAKEVIVKGTSFEYQELKVERVKKPSEFVCGDNVCETGEKIHCFADCLQKNCSALCAEQKFAQAFCRSIKSNPNVPSCLSEESDFGDGYCANQRTCCCFNPPINNQTGNETQEQEIQKEKEDFLSWLWKAIREFFAIIF